MVEVQVICKILQDRSLSLMRQNNVERDHFITYKPEIDFILSHHKKYGQVPDIETFLTEFPDFDLITVTESDRYLIDTLHEQYLYSEMVPFVHELANMTTEDAEQAVSHLMKKYAYFSGLMARKFNAGYDLTKNSEDRKKDYQARLSKEGLLGISTGIPELDELLHGWMNEDFIAIVGRTGEGKTWWLLFFLVMARQAGKRVLLYSGEMSHNLVGYRHDTLDGKFKNSALMSGSEELGTDNDAKTPEDYYAYLDNLAKSDVPFIVVTPKDLGGKRLDIPTLHHLIELYKPDIIGLDQISLMEDYRAQKGDPTRIKYTHISEDVFLTSEKYQIPILAPVQANRKAEEKKKDNQDATPEVHEIQESDGIAQNATRVISIKQLGSTVKISIKKDRYFKDGGELLMLFDVDLGIIRPFLQTRVDKKTGEVKETKKLMQGEDLF